MQPSIIQLCNLRTTIYSTSSSGYVDEIYLLPLANAQRYARTFSIEWNQSASLGLGQIHGINLGKGHWKAAPAGYRNRVTRAFFHS